jgi:hypothetical protein
MVSDLLRQFDVHNRPDLELSVVSLYLIEEFIIGRQAPKQVDILSNLASSRIDPTLVQPLAILAQLPFSGFD